MGEAQSAMLSPLGGTWLLGNSAAAGRTSSLGGEGVGGRAEPTSPAAVAARADAVGAALAAAAAARGRGDFTPLGGTASVSRVETRECVSYRLGRSTFIRTPIMWGVGRSSSRFDFGVSLRARRISASSSERTTGAAEAMQEEARKCREDTSATSRDEAPASSTTPDATSTPDGPAERELMCSVCLELLWKPTVLDCGHSFCFWCAFQCMNLYDVSRCPLCKNTFDKFPPVSRPLDLFLLRHFPRTTKQRDKEMEEFESHRHRRSPCHSRIADLASGSSTDILPASQLQWLLQQKAPDLVRPAAAQGKTGMRYGENDRLREKQEVGPPGSRTLIGTASRRGETSSFRRLHVDAAASDHVTQPSIQPAVRRNGGWRTPPRVPVRGRIGGGGRRARGLGDGERAAIMAERGMLPGRRLLGGDRVRSPAYSEVFTSSDLRVNPEESRMSSWHAEETRGDLVITSRWQTATEQVRSSEREHLRNVRQRPPLLRSETMQEFAAGAAALPRHINWRPEAHRASDARTAGTAGTAGLLEERWVENGGGHTPITSLQHSPRTPHVVQGDRRPHRPESQEEWSVRSADSERLRGFFPNTVSADTQISDSLADPPGDFTRSVEPTHEPEARRQLLSCNRPPASPLRESSDTDTVFLSEEDAGNSDHNQEAYSIGTHGSVGLRRDRAHSRETTVDEWEEWDSLDEGDVSLGLLDPRELTTGHRRNPGDEPLQPMDIEEEEVSGFMGAIEEEFAFSDEFRSTSLNSVLAESDPTRLSDAEEEGSQSFDNEETRREAQETEENATVFQQEDFVHYGIHCDGCGKMPIVGRRHRCLDCGKEACGFDLCGACKDAGYDKRGRFDQNHSNKHKMKLVQPRDAEWWIQSLNRMKKIHPELTIHQILQWILMHYQEMRTTEEPSRDDVLHSRRDNGRTTVGFD